MTPSPSVERPGIPTRFCGMCGQCEAHMSDYEKWCPDDPDGEGRHAWNAPTICASLSWNDRMLSALDATLKPGEKGD